MKKILGKLKSVVYVIAILFTVAYIVYRTCYTLPVNLGVTGMIFALIVLGLEIWESMDFFVYYLNILSKNKKSPVIPTVNDITLYPNIKVDNQAEELTFIINIKRGESKALKDFNNKSKYLKALANDNIIYLYYACFVTAENVIFVIDTIISSLQVLENDIINL